ncbi:hypothetical protein L208DRAFT_808867 [Tricholoma matsutake]|nr:hypothetical protein L208DRAFT_808867 [Tricholoma matsutake 945]
MFQADAWEIQPSPSTCEMYSSCVMKNIIYSSTRSFDSCTPGHGMSPNQIIPCQIRHSFSPGCCIYTFILFKNTFSSSTLSTIAQYTHRWPYHPATPYCACSVWSTLLG